MLASCSSAMASMEMATCKPSTKVQNTWCGMSHTGFPDEALSGPVPLLEHV
jgi:hypothetical protein